MNDKRLYKIGGGWGNHIGWSDLKEFDTPKERFHVYGHQPRKPQKGDFLTAEMKSGKTAVFVFADVTYCGDPPDMFFGAVDFIGYSDEVKGLPKEHGNKWLIA